MSATVPMPFTARRVELRAYPLAVGGLVVLGVLLRFWDLGGHFLTYDEAFTANVARGSLADLIAATAGDVHPPLSYMVVWGFVRVVGAVTPLTVRLPGAILSALALPALLALAGRLKLSRAGTLVGLALFALSPFQVHYAQDARMYPLLQLAVLGALVAVWDRRWWLLALCLTVALWTHNYGTIYTAVIGLLALLRELTLPVAVEGPRGELVKVADPGIVFLAVVVPVVLWLPWLAVLQGQMDTLSTGYWIPPLSLGQALHPLYSLLWGVTMPARLVGIAAVVGYAAVIFALVKALRLGEQRALVWLVVGPFLLAAGISLAWQPVYLFRGFIGVLGPLCLLLGWAVTTGTSWRMTAWAGLMVVPLMGLALANRLPALRAMTGENDRALLTITANFQPGDIVYHGNVGSLSGFMATAPAWMPQYLMPVQPGSVGVLTPETRQALGMCEGPLGHGQIIADCGRDGPRGQEWQRVWLVWGASQTISGVEDAVIAELLAAYPHEKVLDIREVYHGPMPVDGGVWLLTWDEKGKPGVPKP
jgi:hypothetical protein